MADSIFVLIKSPNNVFSVQVNPSDSILTLRQKVADRTENLYQLYQFELNFNGKKLSDSSSIAAEGIQMETLVDMVVIRELKYNVNYKSVNHEIAIANNQGLKISHLLSHIKETLKIANDVNLTLNKKGQTTVLLPEYLLQDHLVNGDELELKEVSAATAGASTGALSDQERELLSNFVDTAISSDVEIVFVFDTTGSMSSIIENVKQQVEATITRLTKDIPNIKIGVMGLGDYCDGANVLKTLDLTDNTANLIQFIKNVPMTGGGDSPEAYEYALYQANTLSWSAHTSKALVMIGDEGPHPPSHTDLKINWFAQADDLAAKGVKIYGIRAKCDQPAFYNEIAERTGGIAINFDRFSLITEMFMAICYRETSARKFQAFQNEVFNNTTGIPVEMTRIFDDLNKENFAREDNHSEVTSPTTTTTTASNTTTTTAPAATAAPKKVYGEPLQPIKSTASWFNIANDKATKPTYYYNPTCKYFTTSAPSTPGKPLPVSTTVAPKPLKVTFEKPAPRTRATKPAAVVPAPKKENKQKLEKVKVQMETRLRKKARESLDFIAGSKQRQESLFNLLGKDYTGPTEQELEMIFRVFDTNNDGKIGAAELGAVLQSMGKRAVTKRIDKILSEIDEDHTGYVEMADFVTYMQAKAYKKAQQMGFVEESEDEEEEEEEEDAGGDTDEEMDEKPTRKAKGASSKRKRATTTSTPKKKTTAEKEAPVEKEKKTTPKKKTTVATTPDAPTTTTTTELRKQPSFFGALKKGTSLCHYYTDYAGKHNSLLISNPVGPQFDLGLDDAFLDFNVLVQLPAGNTALEKTFNEYSKNKGFNITFAHDDDTVTKRLTDATGKDIDILVVVSGDNSTSTPSSAAYVKAVTDFNHSGKGLFILADNSAYNQATSIVGGLYGEGFSFANVEPLEAAPTTEKVTLEYSDGKNTVAKQFKGHLLTTGLVKLTQGENPCQLKGLPTVLDPLAISANNTTTILTSNDTNPDNYGRVVIDTSASKINVDGQKDIERYLGNVLVWLLGIDHRFRHNLPVKGGLRMREVVTWQFQHGSWLNYDPDASQVCEEAYQEWKLNPGVDVRSVKSGHWSYQVNFRTLLQTNVLHSAHTQRPVRRFVQQIVNTN